MSECFARAPGGLTGEEQDQLRRSIKKPKVGDQSQETVVCETLVEEHEDTAMGEQNQAPKELFPTATGMALSRPLVSYRDICQGVNGGGANGYVSEEKDWLDDDDRDIGFSEVSEEEDDDISFNPLCPVVKLSKEELYDARQPWKRALIVKVSGKRMSRKFLEVRLLKLWKPLGDLEVIDLENDYFLVWLSNRDDIRKVIFGGPWMVLDHYLVVQRWRPEFRPFEEEFKKVAV